MSSHQVTASDNHLLILNVRSWPIAAVCRRPALRSFDKMLYCCNVTILAAFGQFGPRQLPEKSGHLLCKTMDQLAGLANNTKWIELQALMSGLGTNAPFWRTKSTNGYAYPPQGWDGDWTYHFRLGEYKYIEWCEMSPRNTTGALDLDGIIEACKDIGFEYEQLSNSVKIIGYHRL